VYSLVEHLSDAVKGATGNRSATYLIYGHSKAGSSCTVLCCRCPTRAIPGR
jgi:hypothetical protein